MHLSKNELSWSFPSTVDHNHVEAYPNLLMLQDEDHKKLKAMAKESDTEWTPHLMELVDRVIAHYESHYRAESELIMEEVRVLLLLSPEWPFPQLDDAFLWVGGWRPSVTFYLLDLKPGSKPGLQVGAGLGEMLTGCDFVSVSPRQLVQLDELREQTAQEEAELTRSLSDSETESDSSSSSSNQAFRLKEVFDKADDLRLRTLKSLIRILSPIQAVQFFIPAAQLHLKVRGWAKNKEAAEAQLGLGGGLQPFGEFFQRWLHEQERDLEELTLAISTASTESTTRDLSRLVSQVMSHHKNYYRVKSKSVKDDVLHMLTATWMSPLEHAFLWVGGWRPTVAIHLLYSISGLQLESQLGQSRSSNLNLELGNLTRTQLTRVDELQMQTIKEERELTETLACLQETLADSSMVELSHLATELIRAGSSESVNERVRVKLVIKGEKLKEVFWKADNLRLRTLKNVMGILSPIQGVHLLIGAAELHLRLHEWGN